MPKAGEIHIDVSAGTSKFVIDMEQAKAKIREFGKEAHGSVTGVQAVSASLRVLEGNMTNNLRAAERFVANVLHLGPVLKVAFPVVGAVAFAGVIGELGNKVFDFFKQMREAPERLNGLFREANASLKITNEELAVSNDRLANDIAKLEGKRENTMKLALDETRLAADKLADSLGKDLTGLNKLLSEQNVGFWQRLLGVGGDDLSKQFGGLTGFGGFAGQIAAIGGSDPARLLEVYSAKLKDVNAQLERAEEIQRKHASPDISSSPYGPVVTGTADQTGHIERLRGVATALREQMDFISKQTDNAALTTTKDKLTAGLENSALGKPFADRMKALGAELDGIKAKLAAIGAPESVQVLAKAFSASQKAIEEVNKALEKHHAALTESQKTQIRSVEQTIASTEAESEWRTKFTASITAIEDRVSAQRALTAAIGQGYEATKQANVETRLAQELQQHANDPEWLRNHGGDTAALRSGFGAEFDAQHGEQTAQALQKLNDQIGLEHQLAQAEYAGAAAVRQLELAHKLALIARDNDVSSAEKLIKAETELAAANRDVEIAADVAKINERTSATERLTAATLKGAEAVRQASLENRLAEIAREGDTLAPGLIGIGQRGLAAAGEAQADHAKQVAEAAASADRVQHISDEIAKLQEAKKTLGDTLAIEEQLRDLEKQRLQAIAEQTLAQGRAQDGVRAFFIEMQEQAKTSAAIIYESLNSALDKTSDQLTNLLTGKKTQFAKMFEDIGDNLLKQSIKSSLQTGLGSLGKLLGVNVGAGKPDGTAGNPLHVVVDGAGGPGGIIGGAAGRGGLFGGGSQGGGVFSFLGGLLGHGGGTPDVSSSIDFGGGLASGGDVYPGSAYDVRDGRDYELFEPRSPGRVTPLHKLASTTINYDIDARGAEIGVEGRIGMVLAGLHKSAVSTSVKANHERSMRTPQRSRD